MGAGIHNVSGRSVRIAVSVWLISFGFAPLCSSSILYLEDFSDTSEWFPVFNQNGGPASVTTDGNIGSFFVQDANNVVAFAPVFPLASAGIFNPAAAYVMTYSVVSVSYSTSYSIEIDQFDSDQNYLSTVFNVAPEGTFTGTNYINLGGISWDPNAAYILPKVTMRTGDGNQTIQFDYIDIHPLPEPSSILMVGIGILLVMNHRRRKTSPTDVAAAYTK